MRIPIAFVLIVVLGLTATTVRAQTERVTLSGQVIDADGSPLKNAMVVISSAVPKQGPAQPVAGDYAGCGTIAISDADGNFQFRNMDASLIYSLALSASGFEGSLVDFEPDADGIFQVQLSGIPEEQTNRIQGNVMDADGRPIRGVVITPRHISYGRTTTGSNNGLVTKLAVSDDSGAFELFAKPEVTELRVRAASHHYAIAEEQHAFEADEPCEIQMGKGASIRGRFVFEGQPVAGVQLELVQEYRSMGAIVTPMEAATNAEGVFTFDHLPPDREYMLCTLLQQEAKYVLPVSLVSAPANRKRAELGEVEASSPHRLTIQIRTGDEQALPEKSIVYVSRSRAWQPGRFELGGKLDPSLEITDATADTYEITIRVPGYEVLRSVPLRSPDINRRYRISVDGDTGIAFLLTKSK